MPQITFATLHEKGKKGDSSFISVKSAHQIFTVLQYSKGLHGATEVRK